MEGKETTVQPSETAKQIADDYQFFRKLVEGEVEAGHLAVHLLDLVQRDHGSAPAWAKPSRKFVQEIARQIFELQRVD